MQIITTISKIFSIMSLPLFMHSILYHTTTNLKAVTSFSFVARTSSRRSSDTIHQSSRLIRSSSSSTTQTDITSLSVRSLDEESSSTSSYHTPVMVKECIEALLSARSTESPSATSKSKVFIDGTLGGGGHSLELLKRLNPGDVVFGCDVDEDALENASNRLQKYMLPSVKDGGNAGKELPLFIPLHCNFCNAHDVILEEYREYLPATLNSVEGADDKDKVVDGILLDLGVSSYQINTATRGFTYISNGPLDMRMNSKHTLTAAHVCNEFSLSDLSNIFHTYGDESKHKSNVIAGSILNCRPLATTSDLVNAISSTGIVPKFAKRSKRAGLSSTSARIFQSLRIFINKEDFVLEKALLEMGTTLLKPTQGRMVVLSYHSIEDRIVKRIMKHGTVDKRNIQIKRDMYGNEIDGGTTKPYKMVGKFYTPTEEEIEGNSRARSAILRIADRL